VVGLNLKGEFFADKPKKKRKASVLVLSHKEQKRRRKKKKKRKKQRQQPWTPHLLVNQKLYLTSLKK
jgi:hypothetical protein